MATGTFAARPGGFAVKTSAQTLSAKQTDQVLRNLEIAQINVISGDATLVVAHQIAIFTKGSAAAIVLPAPVAADNGLKIQLVAGSAFAHVITGTGLLDDGVTGGAKNTITLGAFVGASCEIMAYNLHWVILNLKVATIA